MFSPDNKDILTALEDGTLYFWTSDGFPLYIREIKDYTGILSSAVFSHSGDHIMLLSCEGTVQLYYCGDLGGLVAPEAILKGHNAKVLSAVFSPNNQLILTASEDNTCRLWDNQGNPVAILEWDVKHQDGTSLMDFNTTLPTFANFSPDGNFIITTSWDGAARLWDSSGNFLIKFVKLSSNTEGRRTAIFYDNNYFLTCHDNGKICKWLIDPKQILSDITKRNCVEMTWQEMEKYNIDLIEQSAGIDTVKYLLEAEPNEYSLYNYARYYYAIARKNPEEREEYRSKSLKLYDALIQLQPLQIYIDERERAKALLNALIATR